ncbi:MAG: hypothetical protein AB7O62_15795 [Pirellulales bacterium]
MTSGVMVDVQDTLGNSIAQAVYVDWRGRPVPGIGDTMCCDAVCLTTNRGSRVRGVVRARFFDVQTEASGAAAIWVRIELELLDTQPLSAGPKAGYRARFSSN